MPYLRYNNKRPAKITHDVNAIRSMEAKVYNGDAVAFTETNEIPPCTYITKKYKQENWSRGNYFYPFVNDDYTEYTFRFGYNNGYPCIFITFTDISEFLADYEDWILGLEIENYNASPYGKWQCINVFADDGTGATYLKDSTKNITWMYTKDIQLNVEYCLYIVASDWCWHHNLYRFKTTRLGSYPKFPSNWEMRLNIRPTIRQVDGKFYTFFQKSMKHFLPVKYPISSEKKI